MTLSMCYINANAEVVNDGSFAANTVVMRLNIIPIDYNQTNCMENRALKLLFLH